MQRKYLFFREKSFIINSILPGIGIRTKKATFKLLNMIEKEVREKYYTLSISSGAEFGARVLAEINSIRVSLGGKGYNPPKLTIKEIKRTGIPHESQDPSLQEDILNYASSGGNIKKLNKILLNVSMKINNCECRYITGSMLKSKIIRDLRYLKQKGGLNHGGTHV